MSTRSEMTSLSRRGLENIDAGADFESLVRLLTNLHHEEKNPDGIISLGVAENSLMHQELAEYFNKIEITPYDLTYGEGPYGSRDLCSALAKHFNQRFKPQRPIYPDQILVAGGVTSVIDLVAFGIADEGDGILIGRPLYTNFTNDLKARSKVRLIAVSSDGGDPMGEEMVLLYEEELKRQMAKGVTIRGLILCNPHNPLGKCYSAQTLKAYMAFCQKYDIHFISDEVYAMSIFHNQDYPDAPTFTSALSIPMKDLISPHLVHILYGASKDLASNGLRVGVLLSQSNRSLITTLRSIACFAWPSSISCLLLTSLLTDTAYLDTYFAENSRRLAMNYKVVTDFLTEQGIGYVKGGNSGFFLWADFRGVLGLGDSSSITSEDNALPPANCDMKEEDGEKASTAFELGQIARPSKTGRDRDAWFFDLLHEAGVFIATGEAFWAEEQGWYRITFSVREEELMKGLERLGKVIEVAKKCP